MFLFFENGFSIKSWRYKSKIIDNWAIILCEGIQMWQSYESKWIFVRATKRIGNFYLGNSKMPKCDTHLGSSCCCCWCCCWTYQHADHLRQFPLCHTDTHAHMQMTRGPNCPSPSYSPIPIPISNPIPIPIPITRTHPLSAQNRKPHSRWAM